jgi:hypothetical protein
MFKVTIKTTKLNVNKVSVVMMSVHTLNVLMLNINKLSVIMF